MLPSALRRSTERPATKTTVETARVMASTKWRELCHRSVPRRMDALKGFLQVSHRFILRMLRFVLSRRQRSRQLRCTHRTEPVHSHADTSFSSSSPSWQVRRTPSSSSSSPP
ncbi:hypothetical protein TraAM80_08863 [Trypanosoma rangeli]|uniref:Uncharacterized protein n=1 Tax=Trypanosoma rangeli TaxID=5698 RepID=A0A3R7M334_TRYRA|nr:uncharacterized protein TraAM80_08863 [Trypanosoma rangeli]RNE98501.1 hypothetical protein TraAM80_08863 [Trypanosoma rangeli]|eukprot:RNE98501.1 hypothetical protein TraAM80_08863 [Trypanosoma rangeli]